MRHPIFLLFIFLLNMSPLLLFGQHGLLIEEGLSNYNPSFNGGGGGYLWIGDTENQFLSVDRSNIQSRSSDDTEPLFLNPFGGEVGIAHQDYNEHGKLGIGANMPVAKLHIKESNFEGTSLGLTHYNEMHTWRMGIDDSKLRLLFGSSANLNGNPKGWFDEADGSYNVSSDRRLKEDIRPIPNGTLEKMMRLRPVSYYFKDDQKKNIKSVGYIAQELEKVFPDAVQKTKEKNAYRAVNYTMLGVLSIKAIQELKKEIDAKTVEIAELEILLTELEQTWQELEPTLASLETNITNTSIDLTSVEDKKVSLYQNYPNPFMDNTIIQYFIPENSQDAVLVLKDGMGQVLNSIPLPAKGEHQLELSLNDLPNGMYYYTLVIDGESISTKKMVKLAKTSTH